MRPASAPGSAVMDARDRGSAQPPTPTTPTTETATTTTASRPTNAAASAPTETRSEHAKARHRGRLLSARVRRQLQDRLDRGEGGAKVPEAKSDEGQEALEGGAEAEAGEHAAHEVACPRPRTVVLLRTPVRGMALPGGFPVPPTASAKYDMF